MIKNEDYVPSVISGNESRAGVTGHHVRYVLVFGLAGVIIAFVAIGLYFYYGKVTQTISQTWTRIDPTTLVSYGITIALAAVATVLLLGLWNMVMPRGSPNTSQTLMRWRVVLQFIALCLVMAALYLSGKYQ
jgi:succinate dehydrogenase/fumarate reductase cytochrome b subunit